MALRMSESEVLEACRNLFGKEIQLSRDFLFYLQPGGAKSAYRQKVKETHPDLFSGASELARQSQTALFQELLASYEKVCEFFRLRDSGHWKPAPVPHAPTGPVRPAPTRPHGGPTRRAQADRFYNAGVLPRRPLQIGIFLYYKRIIAYSTLIEALMWQRRQRPNLGDIAQRWGWLKEGDVRNILSFNGGGRRFGEKAISLDFLSPRQLQTMLFYQRSQQQKLGQFFVERQILTFEEIERLAAEHREHNWRFETGFDGCR